jgi:hypothetical protein
MTIVAVGVCVEGWIRKAGTYVFPDRREQHGVTSPMPCEKCGGKGCPKPSAAEAEPAE